MYKVKSITAEKIVFENGFTLTSEFTPDCCEYNHADFSSLKDTTFETDVHEDIRFEHSEYGIIINGYLVNCYSDQNGYYSPSLDAVLRDAKGNKIFTVITSGEIRGGEL